MPNSNDFNHFSYNPTDIHIDRSLFNMDHSVKFSCNVGEVIPFEVIECLPGDTWSIDTSKVVRLQPLVAPIMDEVILDVYYFFVPHRLVWSHWKEFCGENNSSPWAPVASRYIPQISPPNGGWNVGTIADYMGIPPKVDGHSVNAIPFRSYAAICNDWFRSEAIMNPVNVSVGDTLAEGSNGSDQVTDIQLGGKPFIACKFFDYFTSALPSPQRGDPAAVFPSTMFAPVFPMSNAGFAEYGLHNRLSPGNDSFTSDSIYGPIRYSRKNSSTQKLDDPSKAQLLNITLSGTEYAYGHYTDSEGVVEEVYPYNLFARIGSAPFYINDLRSAFAVQRYLEKSARFGGRYIEFVKGFFGVDSPDARLQRTEYLGGSRLSLNINSVEQTSATQDGTTPLGNVAGMSVTGDINSDVTYSCTEHGLIIGCSVLRYHHSYQQGLNKIWNRRYFEEFYLPTFAFLGEQAVYQDEIYYRAPGAGETLDDTRSVVFGYQERWSEYRYMPNRVAGEMRSVYDQSLDMWHLGDYYVSAPTLTPEWLREDKTMLDRCLAVTSDVSNQAICDFYIQCEAARPLPMYSIPGMIDHY